VSLAIIPFIEISHCLFKYLTAYVNRDRPVFNNDVVYDPNC